jgi:hypothetical protein
LDIAVMTSFDLSDPKATSSAVLRRMAVWHWLLFAYYCVAGMPCILDLVERSMDAIRHSGIVH